MKQLIISIILLPSLVVNAQTKNLQVESNHSTVGFSISIAGFSKVTGKFNDYKIDLEWNDEDLSSSEIRAEILVGSINTGIHDRDAHLKTADFFSEEEFPTITFKSDSIVRVDFAHFNAFGKFSMHGVTKNILLPFEVVKMDGNTIGFKSRSTLNRLDYGVGSEFKHTSMPNFLSNEIHVAIDFWTKKRKE